MGADARMEVSLILTDDQGIQRLNKAYRALDQPTDVLSFPALSFPVSGARSALPGPGIVLENAGSAGQRQSPIRPRLLGDVVLSTERAEAQAASYGHSVERETAFLTVHGMLHLLGMDHIEEKDRIRMERYQEQILAAMGLQRKR